MTRKKMTAWGIAGSLIIGGLVNACGSSTESPDASGSTVTTPTTATSPATPTTTAVPTAPAPDVTLDEPEADQDPTAVKFGQTFKLDNGNEITMSKPAKFRSSNSAAPKANAVGALFTVTVKNGTNVPMSLVMVRISAASGSTDADEVFDMDKRLGGGPTTRVRPGGSSSWRVGFIGDATKPWIVDVSLDSDTVTFIS